MRTSLSQAQRPDVPNPHLQLRAQVPRAPLDSSWGVLRGLLLGIQALAPSITAGCVEGYCRGPAHASLSPKLGWRQVELQKRSEVEGGHSWGRRCRPGVPEAEKQGQRSPFPRPLALPTPPPPIFSDPPCPPGRYH